MHAFLHRAGLPELAPVTGLPHATPTVIFPCCRLTAKSMPGIGAKGKSWGEIRPSACGKTQDIKRCGADCWGGNASPSLAFLTRQAVRCHPSIRRPCCQPLSPLTADHIGGRNRPGAPPLLRHSPGWYALEGVS